MISKVLKISSYIIIIILIVVVAFVWIWDQNGKMVFYVQNPETKDYLTIIIRSSPSTDYNWVLLGKRSMFNPLPGSQYQLTKGEMIIGYNGNNWILKNCIDREFTFKEKPQNIISCNFDPIPEENILYYPYSLVSQNDSL
ncbi:MAG: hypothetical protein ACMZ7B_03915 [Balneola sp.]